MSLLNLRKVGTLLSVSSTTIVSMQNQALETCTGPVFKCIVQDLSKKILPSPNSGATYQGVAKLIDSSGNVGCFVLVGANPKPVPFGDYEANEIWISSHDLSFWQAEYGSSQASDLTTITSPSTGMKIAFDTITGSNPSLTDTIKPSGWDKACVSPTLRGHRQDVSEEIAKLAERINSFTNFDLSALLKSDHVIISGSDLSWTSGLNVNVAPGKARFKGIEFDHEGGSISLPQEKTIYRALVDQFGVYKLQSENSTGGNLDADYNPVGTGAAQLPTAAVQPFTLVGSGTASVSNGILTMQQTSGNFGYERNGSVGPSASGSYEELWIADISSINPSSPFNIVIDDGVNRETISIKADGEITSANGNRKVWLDNPKKPFVLGIGLKSGLTTLYLNNAKVWEGTAGVTVANKFSFGWLSGVAGTGDVKVARLRTWNAGERKPSFPNLVGTVLGTIITTTAAFTKPVGLLAKGIDFIVGNINLDGWNRAQIGKVFTSSSSFPESDELILSGAALNRTIYASLFFKNGTQDGIGDGSTTFNIANAIDRTIVGAGGTYSRGSTGGAKTHPLTAEENGPHTHIVYAVRPINPGPGLQYGNNFNPDVLNTTTSSSGSGTPHNNMQPYLALLPVIKFK